MLISLSLANEKGTPDDASKGTRGGRNAAQDPHAANLIKSKKLPPSAPLLDNWVTAGSLTVNSQAEGPPYPVDN